MAIPEDEGGRSHSSAVDLPSSEGVPAGGPLPAARLLMVEPDEDFGRLVRDYLASRGWSISWVRDGRDAVRRWNDLAPDLLITELGAGDLDGFDLIDTIRRTAYPPPIVVLTRLAGARLWDAETLAELGISALRVRPLRFPELAQTLEDVIAAVPVHITITEESLK